MKKGLVLLIIIGFLLVGCHETSNPTSIIEFQTSSELPRSGEFERFTVTITEEELTIDKVTLYLNMEGMNHPLEGTMEKEASNLFTLDLPIAMGGTWYAIVRLYHKDDVITERFDFEAIGDIDERFIHGYHADNEHQ